MAPTATVVRAGRELEIPRREVVPGDALRLTAGDVVPADGQLLASTDLFVNEAVLTGESLPAEKDAAEAEDRNLFLGTSVMSGGATMVAVLTGRATAFGAIAERLAEREPETAFERGIRRFALLITRLVFLLVLFVFLVNILLERDPLESFLFAVALAIGLTPELLPMVTSVTLARGAVRMAHRRVIVKRLPAIQNLGSMDVLCTLLVRGGARAATGPPLGRAAVRAGLPAAAATRSADALRGEAEAYLAGQTRWLRNRDLAVTHEAPLGDPVAELIRVIRPTDVVVMTTHGRGGVRRWLLGSVAERLVREAAAPVLLVRGEAHDSQPPAGSVGPPGLLA